MQADELKCLAIHHTEQVHPTATITAWIELSPGQFLCGHCARAAHNLPPLDLAEGAAWYRAHRPTSGGA